MKRWFIARVGDYEGDGALVPKVNLYECNSRVWSKAGFGWCFGQLAAKDLTPLQADPDIFLIPDGAMDNAISTFPVAVRNNMKTKLEAAGFLFTGVKTTWTVRQLLVYLLKQLQPTLDTVESGDVRDIEA